MEKGDIFPLLPEALLPWYRENKRDLPWREDRDPYHIWVSEIMLQQTRVEAVKGYYRRFLEAFPTVLSLSQADDEKLHKIWEGLGYYSRVRNMKKAAQVIVSEYHGAFPAEKDALLRLPGIGDYTAGAIASIAFHLPAPAVDGNVLRVISRLTDDPTPVQRQDYKRRVRDELAAVYPEDAGAFTQALMELGATVCGPNRKPDCDCCPCALFCLGHQNGTAESLPVKESKKSRRAEELTVFILRCDGRTALEKRGDRGLLAGLWQFPNSPGKLTMDEAVRYLSGRGMHPAGTIRTAEKKHIFTHVQWNMLGYYLDVDKMDPGYSWMTEEELDQKAALPTAFRQFRVSRNKNGQK